MADTKVSALTAATSMATSDLLYGVVSAASRKITVDNFQKSLSIIGKVTLTQPATGSTLTIADGKTLTVNKTMSFTAADDTGVYTLPTGTKTLVDTGVTSLSSLAGVGTLTSGATGAGFTVALGTSTVTGILGSTNGGTGNGFTKFTGPTTAEKTFTLPDANATLARTDAGQTFTGVQSMTSPDITTSITTPSTTFSIANATATTLNIGGAATTFNMAGGSGAVINLGGGANAAELRFLEPSGSGTNFTAFKAQAQAADLTYTLPAAQGAASSVLTNDGSGGLSWATVTSTPRFYKTLGISTATSSKEYTTTVTGSGAVTAGQGAIQCATSTTTGSQAAFVGEGPGGVFTSESFWDESPEIQCVATISSDTSTAFVSYLLCGGNGTFPAQATGAYTVRHFGFLVDTSTISATNANGTTQTTASLAGVTITNVNTYRAVQSGSTNIKFYVNKVLKSTSTTNLPSGATNSYYTSCGIQNDSGVGTSRNALFGGFTIAWNAE